MSKFTNMLKIMRLPKGLRGVARNTKGIDEIVYPTYTKLNGLSQGQAARNIVRSTDDYSSYAPEYRMPKQRSLSMLNGNQPMRRGIGSSPMIRDINGRSVPDRTALGLNESTKDLVEKNIPVPYNPPTGSVLKDYTKPLSAKGMAIPLQQKALHSRMREVGTVRPIDWANAEAGDPQYANKAYAAIQKYVKDPANGFYEDISLREPGMPTYSNPTTGNVSSPSLLWSQMNRRHPYVQNTIVSPHTAVNHQFAAVPGYGNMKTNMNTIFDKGGDDFRLRDGNRYYSYIRNSAPPQGLSSTTDSLFMHKTKLRDKNRVAIANAQATGHEIGHLGTLEYLTNGTMRGPWNAAKEGYNIPYHVNPVELGQAAAHFKRQYFRNTGKLIDNHDKVDDAIAYARAHMEDFDPESRRFLMSVDHIIDEMDVTQPSRVRDKAYSRYEQLKRGIPLLFGGAVAAPMSMTMQGEEQQ